GGPRRHGRGGHREGRGGHLHHPVGRRGARARRAGPPRGAVPRDGEPPRPQAQQGHDRSVSGPPHLHAMPGRRLLLRPGGCQRQRRPRAAPPEGAAGGVRVPHGLFGHAWAQRKGTGHDFDYLPPARCLRLDFPGRDDEGPWRGDGPPGLDSPRGLRGRARRRHPQAGPQGHGRDDGAGQAGPQEREQG
ncbi:unnamed protein product, partial [Prorocentrum cordatum]